MQLIDKTEDILSGSILKTGDFEMYKKVIGVNSSNLVPNAQGVVPLASTLSLEKEKKAFEVSNDVVESVDLGLNAVDEKANIPVVDDINFSIPSIELDSLVNVPIEEQANSQGTVPVSVGDVSSLENIDLPNIPSIDSVEETQSVDENKKVIPDLELPDFSDTKLDVPVISEDSSKMFVDDVVPTLESKDDSNVQLQVNHESLDNKTNAENNVDGRNIVSETTDKFKDVEGRKEKMLNKIMSFISEELDLYLSENMANEKDSSKLANSDVISSLNETKSVDTSGVVDSMINQIQVNPELPEEESGLSL